MRLLSLVEWPFCSEGVRRLSTSLPSPYEVTFDTGTPRGPSYMGHVRRPSLRRRYRSWHLLSGIARPPAPLTASQPARHEGLLPVQKTPGHTAGHAYCIAYLHATHAIQEQYSFQFFFLHSEAYWSLIQGYSCLLNLQFHLPIYF